MSESEFSWSRALYLSERSAAGVDKAHRHAGTLEYRNWKKDFETQLQMAFQVRLEADALPQDQFASLLGETDRDRGNRIGAPPEWWGAVKTSSSEPVNPQLVDKLGLLGPFGHIIESCAARVARLIENFSNQFPGRMNERSVFQSVMEALPDRLTELSKRTLTLELHVAKHQGVLTGDTSRDQFQSFCSYVSTPERRAALFDEYPVLARHAYEIADDFIDATEETLSRILSDWPLLVERSILSSRSRLISVSTGLGDLHHNGRAVAILETDCGERVVYKPRPVRMEYLFQSVLAWLNATMPGSRLKTVKVVDRTDYGYMEFVEASPAQCPDELVRYYKRMGTLLAVMYALRGSDLHFENVIASGEHPILIDLETLVTPRHPSFLGIRHEFFESILQSMLLPQLRNQRGADRFDKSGIGTTAVQDVSNDILGVVDDQSSDMRFQAMKKTIQKTDSLPTQDPTFGARAYLAEIEDGFATTYNFLKDHREAFMESAAWRDLAHGVPIRFLYRDTGQYQALLNDANHPNRLRDALDRERLLDRLWYGVPAQSVGARLLAAERSALLRGDIPLCKATSNTRSIWCEDIHLQDFFDQQPIADVQARFDNMNESDLSNQTLLIRQSLAPTLEAFDETLAGLQEHEISADHADLLAGALCLADRLAQFSQVTEEGVYWIVEGPEQFARTDFSLYHGLGGILLFLSHVERMALRPHLVELRETVLSSFENEVQRLLTNPSSQSLGAFDGWGGILYTMSHLSRQFGDHKLLELCPPILKALDASIVHDDRLDVISGSAGAIAGLLCLHHLLPHSGALELAGRCGEHLCDQAISMGQGYGWRTLPDCAMPLLGFSHGAAGIAWALSSLFRHTGETRFLTVAHEGIRYENSHFSNEARNWPDFRFGQQSDDSSVYSLAWCHGAPGIGLARLATLDVCPEYESDVRHAAAATAGDGFGGQHCLCHGDLGNAELLLSLGIQKDDASLIQQVRTKARESLQEMIDDGLYCGHHFEAPGLMDGVAGLGYQLLRIYQPDQVPSILTLELGDGD